MSPPLIVMVPASRPSKQSEMRIVPLSMVRSVSEWTASSLEQIVRYTPAISIAPAACTASSALFRSSAPPSSRMPPSALTALQL